MGKKIEITSNKWSHITIFSLCSNIAGTLNRWRNIMKRKQTILMLCTIFALYFGISNTCYGHSVFQLTRCEWYEEEGPFVESPAEVGAVIGWFISIPPALILSSPSIIIQSDDYYKYSMKYTLMCIGKPFSFLFGAPSYLLKKVFWDGPIYLWDVIYDDASYN